ncbi:MAG: DinB family protein, partial [Bacteroidales bacterium]
MEFRLDDALPVLQRTPAVLHALLLDLPGRWTAGNEGLGTWSPFDVVGHLIHGERTDWVPRVEHMLRHGDTLPFAPFDREAMFAASEGLSLTELLGTFGRLRAENL